MSDAGDRLKTLLDEQLLREMWCAYTLHATPKPFCVKEAMRAVLAVVREHDGRDAERKEREAVRMLACLVRSAGGEIRVPRDTILRNDLVIQRWDDFKTDEIVFFATQDAAIASRQSEVTR